MWCDFFCNLNLGIFHIIYSVYISLEINDNPVNLDDLTFEVEAGKTYILKYSLYPEYDTTDTM